MLDAVCSFVGAADAHFVCKHSEVYKTAPYEQHFGKKFFKSLKKI